MFKPGMVYNHATAKDLDIFVIRILHEDEESSRLLIYWISKTTKNIMNFPGGKSDGTDEIEIKAKDYPHWIVVAEEENV